MKLKRLLLFISFVLMAILLVACGSAPANNWPGISSDGTYAYLAEGQHVYTIHVANGSEATIQTADGPVPARFPLKADSKKSFYGAPALTSDGQMLVGNAFHGDHSFYSVDIKTGNQKWAFSGAALPWMTGALVLNDTVYAPGGDGKLYAISLTGEKRWEYAVADNNLWSHPVTDGKAIFLATIDHDVFAIGQDGKKIWSQKLDNGIMGAPCISGDTLFVGTISGNLYALDIATGTQKWVKLLDGGIWGTPAVDGEKLFIGTVLGKVGKFYAVNVSDGQIIWSKDEEGSIIAGAVIVDEQVIYATEAGRIQSVDKNGAPKWQSSIENAHFYTMPLLVGDTLLMAPMNANFLLAGYDVNNGSQKWTFSGK